MRIIPITVTDEYVDGSGMVIGAAGSHNDVALKITFGEMWDGLSKHITWLDANGENPTIIYLLPSMIEGDAYIVPIPNEAKRYAGEVFMSIKGGITDEDVELKATLSAKTSFRVLESVYDEDAEESQDITPTAAAQLQAEVELAAEDAQDAKEKATQAKNSIDNMTADASSLPAGQEPVVNVSEEDDHVVLSFGIPAGEKGESAGFGTISAEIDGNSGVPTVVVQTSGTDEHKNIHFIFKNIKGDSGDGSGDMLKSEYDPLRSVKNDGGIPMFVKNSIDNIASIPFTTQIPASANTDGKLKIAVLSSEPSTKYEGWIYIITG